MFSMLRSIFDHCPSAHDDDAARPRDVERETRDRKMPVPAPEKKGADRASDGARDTTPVPTPARRKRRDNDDFVPL